MTYIIALDPGRTTGYALWHPISEHWEAFQSKNPYVVMQWIERLPNFYSMHMLDFTVEKYTGGGYKTADGTYTTELVGFFTHFIRYVYEKDVQTPNSQKRLSGMDRVHELIKDQDVPGPHSHDALAHAIVRARELA